MPLKLSPTQKAFNARGDGKFNKPFAEQVEFFRKKENLGTEHYDDILKSAHDKSFVVAGAAKADLLDDLRKSVDKAISEGKSIGWFRKNFEDIVNKHGWHGWTGEDTQAGWDWRTRTIYKTNMSSSYAAGRWEQLNDPRLAAKRPYWKYVHNDTVATPRPHHVAWSGLVLKKDDPWWQTHFPPNGWGCRCRVTAVRAKHYKGEKAPDNGTYEYEDRNKNTHEIPTGIDYGWDYAPGSSNAPAARAKFVADKAAKLPVELADDFVKEVSPVQFVPAKTLAEAEERIRSAGVKSVKLKGLKKDQFNAVLDAVEKENGLNPLKLDKLETFRRKSSPASALYSSSNKSISINLARMPTDGAKKVVSYKEQVDNLEKTLSKFKDKYLGDSNYKQTTVRARMRAMTRRIIDIEAKIVNGEVARPWTVSSTFDNANEALANTVTHELGHYRDYETISGNDHFHFNKQLSVSEYGRTNKREYFAEWFASYRTNGADGVPSDLLKIFESIS